MKKILASLSALVSCLCAQAQTGTFSTINFPNSTPYLSSITTGLYSSNFRSGFIFQTNGSINYGLTGAKANSFRFRWLAHDNGAIDYTTDADQIMTLDYLGNLNLKGAITAAGNIGIGTTTPEGKLDVYGPVFINTNANLNLKASAISPLDPGDVVFVANNNTEYARIYTNPGGADLRFSVGATPTPRMVVANTGNVGIGTLTPSHKLTVEGSIGARKVKVTQEAWADFVFEPDYKLPSLQALETYIRENKHLPDVPSATEVAAKGLDLGEMNKILLQKIEELTLHLIEQEKRNKHLEEQVKTIMEKLDAK